MADLKVVNQPVNQPTLAPKVVNAPVNQPKILGPVQRAQPQTIDKVVSSPINQPKITHIGTVDNMQESKMSLSEFAQSIKAKYPQYQDIDDNELATRMLEKYPQYSNRVFVPPAQVEPEKPKQNILESISQAIVKPFARVGVSAYNAVAAPISAVNSLVRGRGTGQALEDFQKEADATRTLGKVEVKPLLKVAPEKAGDPTGIKTGASALGTVAEIASNFIGGAGAKNLVTAGWKGILKEGVKEGLKYGPAAGALSMGGAGLQDDDHPFVKGLIGTLMGAGLGAGLGVAAGVAAPVIGKTVGKISSKLDPETRLAFLQNKFNNVVDDYFPKAFKPSTTGIKNSRQLSQAIETRRLGVASVLDNIPDESALPKTVDEAMDATVATKKKIFEAYTGQSAKAGERGARLELNSIADELDQLANNPQIKVVSPGTANYASDLATRLRTQGNVDPAMAEDFLAGFNKRSASYWSNPNPNEINNVLVDNLVANKLRTGLNDIVESLPESTYGGLRRQYGALSELEKNITKAAARLSNKQAIGFFDGLGDLLSAGDVMQGILTGSPTQVARGAATKGIGSAIKYLKDPNRLTAKLFADSYKVFKEGREAFIKTQAPKLMKQLPAPKPGSPKASVNLPIIASDKPVITNSAEQTIEGFKNSPPLRRVGGPRSRRANRKAGIGKPLLNKKK